MNPRKKPIPGPHQYRNRARQRSHQEALENPENHNHSPIPTHPLISAGRAALITGRRELETLLTAIRDCGRFAFDTEFIGEMTYFPKLCLIQLALPDSVHLVDPLADLDLLPFWELVADPAIETIVHAGKQDLEPVHRLLGRAPANIFDTQIASGFINLPYPLGLGKMVEEFFGVHLGKGFTFAQWDERPLPKGLLRYAADDVRFLLATRAEIGRRLDALGHAAWAKEECDALCDAALYEFDAEAQCNRVKKSSSLKPRQRAVLKELVIVREQAGRNHNIPPRFLLKDEILILLAQKAPASQAELDEIRGLPREFVHSYGEALIEGVRRAQSVEMEPKKRETKTRGETPADRIRIDGLWSMLMALCIGRGIDSAVVTNRQEMTDFYWAATSGRSLEASPLMQGWRREFVGDLLLQLMRGEIAVEFAWNDTGLALTRDPAAR